ncbi:cellulase family glycosylhydrolase [Streptomyces sp. NPDC005533]|uniref:cellulase family glycosylhydrolase n=1 Tax=Streptomyces sp. NPDC005533 TaxID=3364723 RepID=UPI00369B01D8
MVLRGYAVSGSTKLKESGMLPFRTTEDAAASFAALKQKAGSNVVRFQILWEGAQPKRGAVDYAYLDKAIAQIKEATSRGLRVIVEYHQDLMARSLFYPGSWHTGEGMPDWAIATLGLTGKEYCGPICLDWAQQQLTADDGGVRLAARAFWNNQQITDSAGTTHIQDVFVNQATSVLKYLKSKLTGDDWNRIVGFEPANEPFDGGMEGDTPGTWDTTKLWPFYRRIRTAMDNAGWNDKLEFAEPLVFWNSQTPTVPPVGGTPDPKVTGRIVFTPHFYDTPRQLPQPPWALGAGSGAYLQNFDLIRERARAWGAPAFVSEFGAKVGQSGVPDTARELTGMYQGMNSGQAAQPGTTVLDDYAPVLSGTQWHWDIYRNHHHEDKNGSGEIQTSGDAWNGEDHSVIERNDAGQINAVINNSLIAQAYPQAVQGGLLNFQYSTSATDSSGTWLNWLQLCPGDGKQCHFFGSSNFLFEAWQGRNSDAPTQTYLPPQFNPTTTTIITDTGIYNAADLPTAPGNKANEVVLRANPHTTNGGGRQLLYWTDNSAATSTNNRHFLFVLANAPNTLTGLGYTTTAQQQNFLQQIQTKLIKSMNDGTNPVRLRKTGT